MNPSASNNFSKSQKVPSKNVIVYLYRSVISKKISDEMEGKENENEYCIDEYTDIMDAVEDFVYGNIQELVYLRLNQTEYKTV